MKIQSKQPSVIIRASYTNDELDSIMREAGGIISFDSRLSWLVSKNAIRLHENRRDFSVKQSSDGSFSYSELSNKWAALQDREAKKAYAERMRLEALGIPIPSLPKLPALSKTMFSV